MTPNAGSIVSGETRGARRLGHQRDAIPGPSAMTARSLFGFPPSLSRFWFSKEG